METTEITYLGVPLTVQYKVDGKYYPATYLQPAEYPELQMEEIYVADSEIGIFDLFLEKQLDDIYELVNIKLEL